MALATKHRRFGADLATLLLGAGTSLALSLAIVPFITRLYTPEDFGLAAFFGALLTFLTPVASASLEQAVVLPRDDDEAHRLTFLILGLSACVSLVFALIFVSWDAAIGLEGAAKGLGRWLYILPPSVLLSASAGALEMRRTRARAFRRLSSSNVAQSASLGAVRISLGVVLGSSVGGLLVGLLVSQFTKLCILLDTRTCRGVLGHGRPPLRRLLQTGRRYRDFPLYAAPTAVLNRLRVQLPVYMLAFLFGPAAVGLYAVTVRALRSPLELAGASFRQVFLQRASARRNARRSIADLYILVSLGFMVLALPPFAAIYFYGKEIFAFVLGESWADSGEYAKALLPWLITVIPMMTANAVFYVFRRLNWWLGLQMMLALAGVAIFWLGSYLRWDSVHTVSAFSWVNFGLYFVVAGVAGWLTLQPLPEELAGG